MKGKLKLACEDCGSLNYSTNRGKITHSGRLELKKFCKRCNSHTIHKETK
ncbi:50S ribosomal protein L33 [Bacillus sp. FJAT-50079]|nr:50S ribosomal protein L33 [Bacillus sp. FJAT-50079]